MTQNEIRVGIIGANAFCDEVQGLTTIRSGHVLAGSCLLCVCEPFGESSAKRRSELLSRSGKYTATELHSMTCRTVVETARSELCRSRLETI
jgi:hypothetical protein